MYEFRLIDYNNINLLEYNSYSRKSVFTSIDWMNYIIEDAKTRPAIIRITEKGDFVGYIPMMIMKKCGIKIAGSPFRGWSTCWMGIEVEEKNKKIQIIQELVPFLYKKLGVVYCEITDRDINEEELEKYKIRHYSFETLELKIDKTDEELWKDFKTDCRNFIRQFDRRGALLEIADPNDEFAEEYYAELIDVFAKQGMTPTYSCEKVKCLLRNMRESGNVLCLRVKTPEGKPAATSIFFCDKNKFYFWGGASYREHQHYRPNEAMIWEAIKYFRNKGIKVFDMVGNRPYKQKFGPKTETYYTMQFARFSILFPLRNIAEKIYYSRLKKDEKKNG